MMPQAAVENKKPGASKPLWQPEETFWQRYSPHHEFPLATVSAITLFATAIGLLFLLWILHSFRLDSEADGPPRSDAVEIGGGGGFDGLGPGKSPLAADGGARTEAVPSPPRVAKSSPAELTSRLPDDIRANPLSPSLPTEILTPADAKLLGQLQQEATQAEAELNAAAAKTAARKKAAGKGPPGGEGGPPGGGNTPGAGGGKGGGIGTGVGRDIGPGKGGGRPATRQEVLAKRWRFDLSGEGPEHANKLVAVGVTLLATGPDGRFYLIRDLKKRPVDLAATDLGRHQDEVKWYNTRPDSLRNLAVTLGLRFMPRFVVMLLPKDREQKMAALEHEEFQRRGLQERQVEATWFDFRLQNGTYEPFVVKIEQK